MTKLVFLPKMSSFLIKIFNLTYYRQNKKGQFRNFRKQITVNFGQGKTLCFSKNRGTNYQNHRKHRLNYNLLHHFPVRRITSFERYFVPKYLQKRGHPFDFFILLKGQHMCYNCLIWLISWACCLIFCRLRSPALLRSEGLCPLTPEEAVLVLAALGFRRKTHMFIAGANIYGGRSRLTALTSLYPNLVTKEKLLSATELKPFMNFSSQVIKLHLSPLFSSVILWSSSA